MEKCFSDIVIVGSPDDQWDGAYVDGRLVIKSRRLDVCDLLKALGFNVKLILSHVIFEEGMPDLLADVKKYPYFESEIQ